MSEQTTIDITENNQVAVAKPSFSLASLNLAEKCPSVVVAQTGARLSKYPFQKLKFEEGRRCRVAILTEDVLMVKLHYHPEVGYILCDGGACCKYCDKVSAKYCYPCVVYETNESGKPVSTKIEIKLLALGGELYDQITLQKDIYGSITDIDLIFSCSDAKYQRCQITQAGPALWLKNAETAKYVNEYMTANGEKILDALGRTYTAEQLAEKLGDGTPTEQKFISAEELSGVFGV